MPTSDSIGVEQDLLFVGFLGAIGAFYLCVVAVRRVRFRRLADALGGSFVKTSLLAGKVVGRDFSVEPRRVGKAFRTFVDAPSADGPGTYLLKTPFFDRFPDWDHARILGMKTERAFVIDIAYPRYSALTLHQQKGLFDRLAHSSFDSRGVYEALRASRVDSIELDASSVSLSFSGVVSNVRRVGDAVRALREISRAVRVESVEGEAVLSNE